MRKRLLIGLAVTVSLVLALWLYIVAGWSHMESYCVNFQPGVEQVGFSWSWNPLGFTCTYIGGQRDGDVETSLWF